MVRDIDFRILIIIVSLLIVVANYLYKRDEAEQEAFMEPEKLKYQQELDALVAKIKLNKAEPRLSLTMLFELMIKHEDVGPYFMYCFGPKGVGTEKRYYVQGCFFDDDGEILCEVVSNKFLDPAQQLNEEQIAELIRQGWQQEVNFRLVLPADNMNELVDKCISALKVYGSSEDSEIEINGYPLL